MELGHLAITLCAALLGGLLLQKLHMPGGMLLGATAAAAIVNLYTPYGPGFQDLGFVIHNVDGSPYHPDSITKKWARFVERHNLDHIRLHDLRHTHATTPIQAGVHTKVVSERLGHSDVSITLNTYTHVLPKMDEGAAEEIDSIIFDHASNG